MRPGGLAPLRHDASRRDDAGDDVIDGGAEDQIYGFETRAGTADKLYLVYLFDSLGYAGMNPRGDGYLQVTQSGADRQQSPAASTADPRRPLHAAGGLQGLT